jgi:hypothetical protein
LLWAKRAAIVSNFALFAKDTLCDWEVSRVVKATATRATAIITSNRVNPLSAQLFAIVKNP